MRRAPLLAAIMGRNARGAQSGVTGRDAPLGWGDTPGKALMTRLNGWLAAAGAALLLGACATAQGDPTNSVIAWAPGASTTGWSPEDGLSGMPILIKDNIETRDMPTTAG